MTDLLTPPLAPTADPDLADTVAERLAFAVAPSTGRFQPLVGVGERLAPGTVLGVVGGGRGRADVVSVPIGGTLQGLLVRPGQLVRRGDPLVWIERDAAWEASIAA